MMKWFELKSSSACNSKSLIWFFLPEIDGILLQSQNFLLLESVPVITPYVRSTLCLFHMRLSVILTFVNFVELSWVLSSPHFSFISHLNKCTLLTENVYGLSLNVRMLIEFFLFCITAILSLISFKLLTVDRTYYERRNVKFKPHSFGLENLLFGFLLGRLTAAEYSKRLYDACENEG